MHEQRAEPPHLDAVVTAAAVTMMSATAESSVTVSQRVLADLVQHFDVDVSFLRYNDHAQRTSVLIAEWPPRRVVPDPDPLAVVHFATADPVFAGCEHLKSPAVFRPQPATADYQRLVQSGSGMAGASAAAVPLISGDTTTGTLGFVKFGDRSWHRSELNALQAIASLFAQVQARITAERQLLHLAHHDDLTELPNRRSLLAHLSDRLRGREPVTVLFLDVDRLKTVNDNLGHAAGDVVLRVVAHRLRDSLRPNDFLARLGGDEFVISLVTPMSAGDVGALSERIHATVAKPIGLDGATLRVGASVGVVIADRDHPPDPERILRDADTAMYAAKKHARGTTHFLADPPHDEQLASPPQSCGGHSVSVERTAGSAVIHQAIGILRSRNGGSTGEALETLTMMSDAADASVALVASELVDEAVRRAPTVTFP